MKKYLPRFIIILCALYLIICVGFYLAQESLIFNPRKHALDYSIPIVGEYEEMFIEMDDGISLNGLLLKADSTRGLVFYLHGNRGSIYRRMEQNDLYRQAGYDVFLLDYRGYGKSGGEIENEERLHKDVEAAYAYIADRYAEHTIVVLGYSLGTAFAARVSASHNPALLVLLAPYSSMVDMKDLYYPFVPTPLIKYPLRTYDYLEKCSMPVVIFHGEEDDLIPLDMARQLSEAFKPTDTLITLSNQGHRRVSYNALYKKVVKNMLDSLNADYRLTTPDFSHSESF